MPSLPKKIWARGKGTYRTLGSNDSAAGLVFLAVSLIAGVFASVIVLIWRYEFTETQTAADLQTLKIASSIRATLQSDFRTLQVAGSATEIGTILLGPVRRMGQERSALLLAELYQDGQSPLKLWVRQSAFEQQVSRLPIGADSQAASASAVRRGEAMFAPTYFVPLAIPERNGVELLEAWLPLQIGGRGPDQATRVRLIFDLRDLLIDLVPVEFAQQNEMSLREPDGTVLAWGPALVRGAGVFRSQSIVDLPGNPLILHVNSREEGPRLIPNLLYALLVLLGGGLLFSVIQLFRSIRRRAITEAQLREAFKFRKAMEDSLITGLRARDMAGRVTYVNPAFCELVGFSGEELIGLNPPMPYWAPEGRDEYERRYAQVLAGTITPEGFETIFMRKDGERIPVLIYEAPLIDEQGQQTGWMGSIVDLRERRNIEEINRQQQDRLERASRLSTMGELASVISHELNQPLSAIASYASGASYLLNQSINSVGGKDNVGGLHDPELSRVLGTIQEQAIRAGNIVHRMHEFVRQREPRREQINLVAIVQSLEPLIALQARSTGAVVIYNLCKAEQAWFQADRVLIEQVLLNLTRNAIEAVAGLSEDRQIVSVNLQQENGSLVLEVRDRGPGVDPEIRERLFSMYVSTKAEGLGIGLNICKSVLERYGGQLWFEPVPDGGAAFKFRIPAVEQMRVDA